MANSITALTEPENSIDSRSIVGGAFSELCYLFWRLVTTNTAENFFLGVVYDEEKLRLFEEVQRWRLLEKLLLEKLSKKLQTLKVVRSPDFLPFSGL